MSLLTYADPQTGLRAYCRLAEPSTAWWSTWLALALAFVLGALCAHAFMQSASVSIAAADGLSLPARVGR